MGHRPSTRARTRRSIDHLYDGLRANVAPRDAIEELYVRDAADYYWEVRRLRHLKAKLLESSRANGLWRLLTHRVPDTQARIKLHSDWCRGDAKALEDVATLIQNSGLDESAIEAQTLAALIDQIERIDRLITVASDRVVALFREIDRHRSTLGARLRGAIQAIDDVEFEEVPPAQVEGP